MYLGSSRNLLARVPAALVLGPGVALVTAGPAGVEAGVAGAAVAGAGTVFTGVEVPDTVPGGRPRGFLAGPAMPPSSIFLLLFRMTGGFTAGLSGFAFVLLLS